MWVPSMTGVTGRFCVCPMNLSVSSIGITVTALCAGLGCPQLKNDDFLPLVTSGGGAGGTASGIGGTSGTGGDGGNGGDGDSCGAGLGGCGIDTGGSAGTAGSGGASNPSEADSGAGPDSSAPACGPDEVTGPSGECYFVVSATSTWSAARTSCQARGSGWDLVAIGDGAQNDFVLSITGFEAWVGATDVTEGEWYWVNDGAPFFEVGAATASGRFTNWTADEPNDYDDSDCLRILTTGEWADFPCDSPLGHVCGRPTP